MADEKMKMLSFEWLTSWSVVIVVLLGFLKIRSSERAFHKKFYNVTRNTFCGTRYLSHCHAI